MNTEYAPRIKLMGFVSYQTPWIHFKRKTDEFILYFIKSGELHIQENGKAYRLRKGDVLLLEPNLEHEGLEKHACDYFYVHFEHRDFLPAFIPNKLELAKRVLLEDQELSEAPGICYYPKLYAFPDRSSLHRAFHEMNEMVALHRRKHYNRTLSAFRFAEWMIGLSRDALLADLHLQDHPQSRVYAKINKLLDYIHTHYTQRITGETIEQEFECNYDYINRIFSETTGHTISRYVNLVRINHAKELIEATHLSMNEVGYLVGLNDPFYFSKVFKKYVGLSPTQYDRKIRNSSAH